MLRLQKQYQQILFKQHFKHEREREREREREENTIIRVSESEKREIQTIIRVSESEKKEREENTIQVVESVERCDDGNVSSSYQFQCRHDIGYHHHRLLH